MDNLCFCLSSLKDLLMLTERDIEWLRFMGRFSVVTAQHLMAYADKSKAIISRRLIFMVNEGLVEVAPVTLARRRLYSVTTDGRRRVGLPGKHSGIRLVDAEHDSALAWWFMQESKRLPNAEFLTDREIRSLDWRTDNKSIAPMYAVERFGSSRRLMFPDFVQVVGEKFLAYELEYSPKYFKRTLENMQAYAASSKVQAVMYASPERLLPVIQKAAAKVNKDRQLAGLDPKIYVSRIKDGGENGIVTETVN